MEDIARSPECILQFIIQMKISPFPGIITKTAREGLFNTLLACKFWLKTF